MMDAVALADTNETTLAHAEAYRGERRPIFTHAARRDALLRGAQQEFAEHGFLATKLSAIAQRAGIRKSTIFHYFPTKEALYEDAVTSRLGELATAIEAAAAAPSTESATLRIDAIVSVLAFAFAREKAMGRLVLRAMLEESVVRNQSQQAPARRIVRTLAAAIRVGVEAGHIASCAPTQEAISIVCVVCARSAAMTPVSRTHEADGTGAPADADIDEPVLIGVSDAHKAASIAAQVRRLLNSRG
jgi:AcrR family transcriptional regulator